MSFSEKLNNYIKQFECSSGDLVSASGLSSAVISRYRNGERTPNAKSKHFESLVDGLYSVSQIANIKISREEIFNGLAGTLNDIDIDLEQLSKNFSSLVSALNINIADLSRFINYDASFISKIRTGSRTPSKPKNFIEGVCNDVVSKYQSDDERRAIAMLVDCDVKEFNDKSTYYSCLEKWLSTNAAPAHNYINEFLSNLDSFSLDEYIKAIHFDEMKVPFVPFYKASSKVYYGLEEMKKGELDFFKASVLSRANESVFMCSDMPMQDMANDVEFGKKWMFAIAMMLKKGMHLNIIHNLDRPFNEMMLGLESWIPIYMTGQVSPYFFKNSTSSIYSHLNYVSENVALTGECINGYHDKGKYMLTTNKAEIAYYKAKSECLLNKATPLMEIYRSENKNLFNSFIVSSESVKGNRRRFLASLPAHTLSDKLLSKILKRNKVSDEEAEFIKASIKDQRKAIDTVVKDNCFVDEIYELSKKDFKEGAPSLFLADCFFDKQIYYTYDEYLEHLRLTKEYEKSNENYKLVFNSHRTFKNIQVLICEKNWVMISKAISPSVHFVIHHPKLCDAIENFIPPIVE